MNNSGLCAIVLALATGLITPASAEGIFAVGSIARQARLAGERLIRAQTNAADKAFRATQTGQRDMSVESDEPPAPTELRSSNIPPVALSKTVQRLTPEQQMSLITAINDEIGRLGEELDKRLAVDPKTPEINAEIDAINDALTAKRQAIDLASARPTTVTNAGAESFAAVSNPFFLVCGSTMWARTDPLKWFDQVSKQKAQLIKAGRSVGMVEVDNTLIGTAFVVGKNHVLTNLHVAKDIADYDPKTNKWKVKTGAKITFDVEYPLGTEYQCDAPNEKHQYYITAVYSTPKDMKDDIAVLLTSADKNYPQPLEVRSLPKERYKSKMLVAVLGYPGPPQDMTIAEQITFFTAPTTGTPQFVYKRISGGFIGDEIVSDDGKFVHKANTAGGNSGSPIFDLADGSLIGIHVEGFNRRFDNVLGYNRGLTSERIRTLLVKAGLAN